MIIQRRLNPGAPGTKKYVEKYGDRLVCVRYKYDESSGIKTKTIELVESFRSDLFFSPDRFE